jgi:hypothetical protein
MRLQKGMVIGIAVCTLFGCSSIGPRQVTLDRGNYTQVLRQTEDSQMLTNIVYVRYLEPPAYLKISNLTASYQYTRSLQGTASLFPGNMANAASQGNPLITSWNFNASPSLTYSDAPTISYTPLDNATFVNLVQTPITFNDLVLLFNGGLYDIELYMRLIFNRIGPLDNASALSSPLIVSSINYKKFYEFLGLFTKLLKENSASVQAITVNSNIALQYQFKANVSHTPAAIKMKKLLGISPDNDDFIMLIQNPATFTASQNGKLVNAAGKQPGNVVYVQTRSIYGIISYLSHSVDIPKREILKSYTQQIVDENGRVANVDFLMKNLMRIYVSDSEPSDAFVKTYVKGNWYYIREADLDSKATFGLLMRLMAIVGAMGNPQQQQSPVLTLPVGVG